MAYCNKCGKKINDGEILCEECKNVEFQQEIQKNSEGYYQVTFINPKTNEKKTIKFTDEQLSEENKKTKLDSYYENWIGNCELNADLKTILQKMSKFTKKIGDKVIQIGKIVLNIIINILKDIKQKFPNMIIGAVIGLILGLIISTIPVLGWLLGGIIVPLCTVAGGVLGFLADMKKKVNNEQVNELINQRLVELFSVKA